MARSDESTLRGPKNLADYLDRPDADAGAVLLRFEDRSVNRADLRARVALLAGRLAEFGVGDGDLVAVRLPNSIEAVELLLGVWSVRAAVAPVSPLLSGDETVKILGRLRPALVVLDHGDATGRAAVSALPPAVCWVGAHGEFEIGDRPRPADTRRVEAGAAVVLHTSGTSGASKAVVISHEAMIGAIDSLMGALGARGRPDRGRGAPNLLAFPLFHSAGLYNLALALRNDRELLIMRKFDVDSFVELIETHQVQATGLAPTMIQMLNDAGHIDPRRLSSLRFVRSGSAPLPRLVAQRFHDRFGVAVLNAYGQTETAGEVIGWTADDSRRFAVEKLGSVGRPHRSVEIRFVDEGGREVPAADVGELCVRSPFLMRGYLDRGGEDRYIEGGFLRTGDLGYADEDGFVWLVGRRSDVIICGGYKVLPQEVEDVLRTHDAVADVMVAAVPDERLGEVPHAFVVLRSGAAGVGDELISMARSRMAHFKAPRAVHVVDELPRNVNGKLMRNRAVDLLGS